MVYPALPLPVQPCLFILVLTTPRRGRGVSFLCLLLFLFAGRAAQADTFEGKWKQSPLREDYTVQQWLTECGPAPRSEATGGGELVSVKEEGDELSFVGAGRVYRTNECYDPLPTLVREAHSRDASGRSWQTRCTTPPSDPRRAVMQTRVTATSSTHIEVSETGRYEITQKEGRCIADVKRTRSFDSVSPAPEPTLAPPHAPEPPSRACALPGEPARLEVRPTRKLLRTGESFTFTAIVRDAKGCPTGTATTWTASGGGIVVDGSGKVTVPKDGREGTVELVVTAAGKSAKVTVVVASPAHYDALLAQSGLNASGENDGVVIAEIATSSLGGGPAKASDSGRTRRMMFIGVVGTLAAILGVFAFVGRGRARRAEALERQARERHERRVRETEDRNREKMAKHAEALRAHEESVARAARIVAGATACPACHREYPPQSIFCPADGSQLVAVAGHEAMFEGPAGGICPICKRGFDPGIKVCPHDGEELVPYALRERSLGGPPASRGKICPTCGGKFEGSATFCGKDGTALVLLN